MDDLGWLRLQWEWGADEALDEQPVDRRAALAASPVPPPVAHRPAAVMAARPPEAPPTPAVPGPQARAQALAAAAPTQAALREALAGFDGCVLRATATNLVFSDGDLASRVVLVADVPGAAEDRAGLPFAGEAALFLDKMFDSAGLDRRSFLATSLLPWRPPGDRKPADAEIQMCLPFLQRHLTLAAPRFVLIFGALASKTLLPGDGRRVRASLQALSVEGLASPVPCLVFPAVLHIRTTPACKREAWGHLLQLRRALDR